MNPGTKIGGYEIVGLIGAGSELEDRLFTYLWLSLHTPNAHAGRVAQLIEEAERRGQAAMIERARVNAQTTPVAKAV